MPSREASKGRARPFPWICPNCMTATVVPSVTGYAATIRQDGVAHEVYLPHVEIPKCRKCGETIVTTKVDEQINDALRSKLRLLTPAQMRQGIERFGLQQQELAERLGVAPETISRWLNGFLIQSRAMDNLLRLYFALPAVRAVLKGENQDPRLGTQIARKKKPLSRRRTPRSDQKTTQTSGHQTAKRK